MPTIVDACVCGAHDEDSCPAGEGETCECECHSLDHAHCWEIVGLMRAVNHDLDVSQTIGLSRQDLLGTRYWTDLDKKQRNRFFNLADCHYACFSASRKKPSTSTTVTSDVARLCKPLLSPSVSTEPSLFDRALQKELMRINNPAGDSRKKRRREHCDEGGKE